MGSVWIKVGGGRWMRAKYRKASPPLRREAFHFEGMGIHRALKFP
jgi:hypothetical protein